MIFRNYWQTNSFLWSRAHT